ncbi:MAG: DUF2474 family protein [Methylophilus methylotrophus]|uniref:DUF2474 family protein n=1 Tax=Methylophilus methylotrophus TaxID=17 RepID=A0A5C7WMB3_METME|nr:MAG: DUF2474 family protein [Methylophilus methylotrophus]
MQQAPKRDTTKSSLAKRLGWMLLIWLASVAALAAVSLLMKLFMKAAGFNS